MGFVLGGQHRLAEFVGVAPARLAQVHWKFVLLVSHVSVRTAVEQILDDLDVASHCSPVQRCVLSEVKTVYIRALLHQIHHSLQMSVVRGRLSGVSFVTPLCSISAPSWRSSLTTARWPFPAASRSGGSPQWSDSFRGAPSAICSFTQS